MSNRVLAFVFLLAAVVLAPMCQPDQKVVEQERIFEVVLKYWINRMPGDCKKPNGVFLQIMKKDPPPEVLTRLKDINCNLQNGSAYSYGKGVRLSIDRIEWHSDKSVTVWTCSWWSMKAGAWHSNEVIKISGKWEVLGHKLLEVS
jgi:hypothetical protein